MKKKYDVIVPPIILFLISLIFYFVISNFPNQPSNKEYSSFVADNAYQYIETQVGFGPRIPGSNAHDSTVNFIQEELISLGWSTEVRESYYSNKHIRNIVARLGKGKPWLILGAHYDTRIYADSDPIKENRELPVAGANDGASGVAVLLELARIMPHVMKNTRYNEIWLVFFDAEDNGRIGDWNWILGSRAFVSSLEDFPEAAIIVDMIGDKDLNIYMERNSDPELASEIWNIADALGYSDFFIPQYKYRILDDHIPFREVGVKVVDIIDLDYQYWHTVEDTPDKVDPKSLEIVGNTLLAWLLSK